MSRVLGIVPVLLDDPAAPSGTAALRTLRGRTLVARAVGALVRSGVVDRVVVAAPGLLGAPLAAALAGLDPGRAELAVVTFGPGGLGGPDGLAPAGSPLSAVDLVAYVLQSRDADQTEVLVHDPLHPLAPSALVRLVLTTLRDDDGCAATVPVRQVTDTLKWVDGDDVVLETADRDSYRMVYSPQAYRAASLAAAVQAAGAEQRAKTGADVLPRLVHLGGGRLLSVPAPGEVFRVAAAEDVLLAEAMLQVGADTDDEPAAR